MYCNKCHKEFGKEYVVCPECGEVLKETTTNNGDLNGGYGNTSTNDLPFNQNGEMIKDKSVMYIILSVLMLFCCNQIAGIVSLIFAIMASNDYGKNNFSDAASKWKTCKITLWIGIGLSILLSAISLFAFGASIFTALSNLSV